MHNQTNCNYDVPESSDFFPVLQLLSNFSINSCAISFLYCFFKQLSFLQIIDDFSKIKPLSKEFCPAYEIHLNTSSVPYNSIISAIDNSNFDAVKDILLNYYDSNDDSQMFAISTSRLFHPYFDGGKLVNLAAEKGSLDILILLLNFNIGLFKEENKNSNSLNKSPHLLYDGVLTTAAENGHFNIVKYLLNSKYSINMEERDNILKLYKKELISSFKSS